MSHRLGKYRINDILDSIKKIQSYVEQNVFSLYSTHSIEDILNGWRDSGRYKTNLTIIPSLLRRPLHALLGDLNL
jgi:hypothetical protein